MIVLASTSSFRRQLLQRLGLPFLAVAPAADEGAVHGLPPADLAVARARLKAESLASDFPETLIIGSDQIACIDGEILNKPGTEERARAQLRRLTGREHELLTAVAVHEPATGRTEAEACRHVLRMRVLSEEQIAAYVAHDQPLASAGSFKIESLGIALFESITGADDTAIIGLPLLLLTGLLARFEVDVLLRRWRNVPLLPPAESR